MLQEEGQWSLPLGPAGSQSRRKQPHVRNKVVPDIWWGCAREIQALLSATFASDPSFQWMINTRGFISPHTLSTGLSLHNDFFCSVSAMLTLACWTPLIQAHLLTQKVILDGKLALRLSSQRIHDHSLSRTLPKPPKTSLLFSSSGPSAEQNNPRVCAHHCRLLAGNSTVALCVMVLPQRFIPSSSHKVVLIQHMELKDMSQLLIGHRFVTIKCTNRQVCRNKPSIATGWSHLLRWTPQAHGRRSAWKETATSKCSLSTVRPAPLFDRHVAAFYHNLSALSMRHSRTRLSSIDLLAMHVLTALAGVLQGAQRNLSSCSHLKY